MGATSVRARTEVRLLGGFAVVHDGSPVTLPRSQRRLLAMLGLRRTTSRAQVAGTLWPEVSDVRALASLRSALWRLGLLTRPSDQIVVVAGESIALNQDVRVDLDELVELARSIEDGDPAGEGGADPGAALGAALRGAERLTRMAQAELLPGWYDDWVLAEREHLRQLRLHALEDLARAHLQRSQYGPALRSAIAAERIEPLRETPHRLVMRIHLAEGNSCEALSTYHAYRGLVRRELGVGPSPRMQALLAETLHHTRA